MNFIKELDLEINEKLYKKIFIVGIVFIICYLLFQIVELSIPRIFKLSKNTIVAEKGIIANDINLLYRGKFRLEVGGWSYKNGQSIQSFESYFVLKNKKTGQMYKLPTEMREVPEFANVEGKYNCMNSGMYSQSIVLGLKNGEYDLYILYKNDNENILVNTEVLVEL